MSQPKWNRQLGLAAALFALGSFAYWMEYSRKPKKEEAEELSKKVFQLKDVSVQTIQVSDGKQSFELICSDFARKLCKSGDSSKWQLNLPIKSKADDANVNSLISTLNHLNSSETIDLSSETPEKRAALLKEYGLDPGSLNGAGIRKVSVRTADAEIVAYLGATYPIGEGIFAAVETLPSGQKASGKIDESKVYVLPSYFKSSFEHDLTYWRDKKLLTFASHEIESFDLQSGKGRIQGTRKDGQWILKANKEEFAGDIENVDALLAGAAYLTAKNFAADKKDETKAKKELSGTKQALSLTLQKQKETVTLTFHQKSGAKTIFATASNMDPLFELDATALERLDKSIKDLRLAKLMTSVERFTAKRLEFSGKPFGAQPLVLENKDGKWLLSGKAEVSADQVQTSLDKLSGNRIKEFLPESSIPQGEKEGVTFRLSDEKTSGKREFVFWKNGEKLYARDLQSKRKEAFLIDNAVREALPWSPDFFKKPEAPEAKAPINPADGHSEHDGHNH